MLFKYSIKTYILVKKSLKIENGISPFGEFSLKIENGISPFGEFSLKIENGISPFGEFSLKIENGISPFGEFIQNKSPAMGAKLFSL